MMASALFITFRSVNLTDDLPGLCNCGVIGGYVYTQGMDAQLRQAFYFW